MCSDKNCVDSGTFEAIRSREKDDSATLEQVDHPE